jgi:DNA mismatch repair protein mutS
MPKEIIVPKGVLKDEHISHIEEILNIYITFKEDTYINDLVDEESESCNNNKVKEENTKRDGLDEPIEEFEKALTEKIVTRYNIIERNEVSEEETIIKNSNDIPITIIYAVAYLHKYTKETQMQELKHLNNIYIISENKYMVLDSIARKNLELTQRMKDGSKRRKSSSEYLIKQKHQWGQDF